MGASTWNDDFYAHREEVRKKENRPVFVHDTAIKTGKAARAVHAKLNPNGVKTREARDSKEHPNSIPIGVMLDVTGSMATVPPAVQKQLPKLMGLLTKTGFVADPQILFGAVGDAYSDHGPLQVGQFESGIEMEDDLGNMWLESGGGGGKPQESYQDAIYFFARHTSTDNFEKRNKKGYLFLIGDEMAYSHVDKDQIARIIGDGLQANISTTDIVKEAQEKYHVFFIIPQHTSHGHDASIRTFWANLLGADHVISMEDENSICETIALAVGLTEGVTDLDAARPAFSKAGSTAAVTSKVASSLRSLARTNNRVGTTNDATIRL